MWRLIEQFNIRLGVCWTAGPSHSMQQITKNSFSVGVIAELCGVFEKNEQHLNVLHRQTTMGLLHIYTELNSRQLDCGTP